VNGYLLSSKTGGGSIPSITTNQLQLQGGANAHVVQRRWQTFHTLRGCGVQRLAQRTFNPPGLGSNPSGPTTKYGMNFKLFLLLHEASYAGNIGIMEMVKFHRMASPEQKAQLARLLKAGKQDEAWEFLQSVTGVKLK
jgi:hypothetical protein